MSADFDAYLKWLGIPPSEQPPNHYRLLGLALLESDVDAISNAADRQMSHVRTFQSGPHSALSQKLLNELSAARVCLLNPKSKAEYDRALQSSLSVAAASGRVLSDPPASSPDRAIALGAGVRPRSPQRVGSLADEFGLGPSSTPLRSEARRPTREKRSLRTIAIGGGAVAAASIFLAAIFALTRLEPEPPLEPSTAPPELADAQPADAARATADEDSATAPAGDAVSAPPPHIEPRPVAAPELSNRPSDSAPAGGASDAVDLLKLIDPKRDAVLGEWSFEGPSLLTSPLQSARLQVPYEPPADYQLRLVAQSKPPKSGALFIGLIVGGRQTSLAIDGWNGKTSGMHLLDGVPAGFNPSKREGKVFSNGEPKEIVCVVHPQSVLARCGDLTIVDWRGDAAKLGMEQRLAVNNERQLFLGGWDGQFLVSKFELTALPPEPRTVAAGKPARAEPDAARQPPPDAREAIPDPSLVREANRKVESQYQNDWRRAKKLGDRLGVPFKMLAASQGAESVPVRYALLREASDRAAALGDAPVACEALDELQKHFRLDALPDQAEVVRQSVLKLHDSAQAWSAAMTALSLVDLALRKDELALAEHLAESAGMAAKKSGSGPLRAVVNERAAAVGRRKRERERYTSALETLKTSADDPSANTTAGQYECFYLGRWREGLPKLEKSSSATLAALAALERAAEQDPSQQAALAEAWQAAAAEAGPMKDEYRYEANYWRLLALLKSVAEPGLAPPLASPAGAVQGISLSRLEPGLAAALFNGGDFQQEVGRRLDPLIHINFGYGSPDAKLGGDYFSIRWTGWIKPPLAGKYVLHASADDGFRLWIDGKPILNRWGGAGDESKEVELTEGVHALKIEYNEYGATAAVRLTWKLRDLSTEFTAPASALFHDSAGIAELIEAR